MAKGNSPRKPPIPKSKPAAIVKQVEKDVAELQRHINQLQKKNRELLKKSGKTVKEFRNEVARLKKAGIVSKRVNALSQQPTKYMRSKVRKFYDVLVGTVQALKAPKQIREEYTGKNIFEQRGPFLIIPKQSAKQRVSLDKKGRVKISQPIGQRKVKDGGTRINKIVLAYNATDILQLAERMERDPNLPDELSGAQQYGFSLFGHKSMIGFPNKQEMIDYIKIRYQHLFSGKSGQAAVRHFNLITYSGGMAQPPNGDWSGEKFLSQRGHGRRPGRANATGRNYDDSWYIQRQNKTHAAQEKKRRAKMTDIEREEYRAKARERSAKSRSNRKGKNNG